jgi:hypothetical protein
MDWLFELSAACALIALALPVAFKLLPPRSTLRPVRVRARTPKAPTALQAAPCGVEHS